MTRLLRNVLRIFSYLFLALLCLAALGVSAVIVGSPHETVRVGWLPWEGESLGAALAIFGIAGLILVFLAVLGRARLLLTLFALATLILVARGFFFSYYRFSGVYAAHDAVHMVLGLLRAFLGAIPISRSSASRS